MEMFMVGGIVRDEILGVRSKDIDFSVVLSPEDLDDPGLVVNPRTPFEIMEDRLRSMRFKIFLSTPEFLTVRAQFPEEERGVAGVIENSGMTADFVLARKESLYTDGRRPDVVVLGTLEDDILRRDFTMNALAKDAQGNIIDLVGGVQDINERVIRAVGNAFDRLNEDALRAVRAVRFSVTKGFRIDHELRFAMESAAVIHSIEQNISDERISDELSKMFRFNTLASLKALQEFPLLTRAMFSGSISLDSTMKQKGRGR